MEKNGMETTERLEQLKLWALKRDGKEADAQYHDLASDRWLQVYRNEALNLMKAGFYNKGSALFESYVEVHYPHELEKLIGKLERSYDSLQRFSPGLLEDGFYNLVLGDIPLLMAGTIVVLLRAKESDFPSIYNNDADADMRSSPNWLIQQSNNDIWVDMHQTALNNIHYPDKIL
ncbi:hypothetical protein BCY89_07685 [Sphingobacterium siyangense]|uniref:Uncharacterized protein n=1 Tax=Sphingobacterium siyangense TaxID=459529 RepID=A0A420FPE1_9SPHI|nr:hypothetical protein [Sphingobacterium siyangense]RKF34834.1 hypothetical protein BCY89_07685 [Sphingobacterium siyangense]